MTQREQFEAWATSQGINITDNGFGGYDSQWTEGALAGWEAAQAQAAVEPVPDDIVAGALYDFLGYLTTRRTRITMSDRDDAVPAVDALVDWSKTRNINLTEARVRDWNRYTSQPDHTKAMRLALEIIRLQREWIMAVPQDTALPSMPGFDREWVDRQIAALEKELT